MCAITRKFCINCKVKSAYIRYLILLSILYWHWCLDMIIYLSRCARVAELADAHGSGPCESDFMGVQVPPLAPKRRNPIRLESGFFFLVYPSTRHNSTTCFLNCRIAKKQMTIAQSCQSPFMMHFNANKCTLAIFGCRYKITMLFYSKSWKK